jgi:hypothetical protein
MLSVSFLYRPWAVLAPEFGIRESAASAILWGDCTGLFQPKSSARLKTA